MPERPQSGAPQTDPVIRPRRLTGRAPLDFLLRPDAAACAAIAARLELSALRKLRLEGRLIPDGARDWRLEARLGATVVQPCAITLDPVTTRIDGPVLRRYRAEMPPLPEGDDIEMPEDDTEEPLPDRLDLAQVMEEALALALPLYPRADGAHLGAVEAAPPGAAPLGDQAVRPFAALAGLKTPNRD